jgi:hypothetical protein
MPISREYASCTIIGVSEIERCRDEFAIENMDALTYPQLVKFARLLPYLDFFAWGPIPTSMQPKALWSQGK